MAFRNAQLAKKVVYYFSSPAQGGTGEILMGLPEEFFAPNGFQKIVCTSAAEAELWSGRMRVWEKTKEEIAQMYQRKQEENQFKAVIGELDHKIANARNNVNRDFLIRSRENAVKRYEDRFSMVRESYLHSEAYSSDDKSVKTPKMRLPKKLFNGGVGEIDE